MMNSPAMPSARLHGAVRVVEIGAVLVQRELVDGLLAGLDRLLGDAVNAVDAVGQFEAVQVQDRRFRQLVVDDDAHAVAFGHFNGGAGHAVVVAPHVHPSVGQELTAGVGGVQVKLLDAVLHYRGQLRQVGRRDRHRRLAGLAQTGNQFAAIRGTAERSAGAGVVARILLVVGGGLGRLGSGEVGCRRGRKEVRCQRGTRMKSRRDVFCSICKSPRCS